MESESSALRELLERVPGTGRLEWIGLRPARREPVRVVHEVTADPAAGLAGDRYAKEGRRQVTLVQAEHLAVVAALLGREGPVDPALLRRNLVVSGINLTALKGHLFRVGEVLLEATGPAEPCSRMEENLGEGGYQAMRGHGGITARVLREGRMRVGDPVRAGDGKG